MSFLLRRTADGRMPYYPALDGVRAYCILLVLFDHLPSNGHTLPWLNGHLGLDLFFILSGFLITTLLGRESDFTGRIDLHGFYWRRFFRLAPVYFTVLALYVAVTQLPSQHLKWVQLKAGLPWFLTMMNEYAREPYGGNVFTHSWSLGLEEKFYFVWPILGFLLVRTRRSRLLLLAALFVCVALPVLLGHTYLARGYFGLLMGCLMSLVLASSYGDAIARALGRVPAFAMLLLFALGFGAEALSKNLLPVFSLCAVVFLSYLIVRPTWLSLLHESVMLVFLGRRSYSMYLVHILCINAVVAKFRITSGPRAVLAFLAATALSLLVAEILFHLVERPAREFGRAWLARRHERARAI